jgi:hypothetical protein
LPVRVDAPRLAGRLRGFFNGDGLVRAFDRLFLGRPESRRAIAAIVAERGPTLTEDAWDWIAEEEDDSVLDFLLTLAAVQNSSLAFSHLQRAMFENAVSCRHAVQAAAHEALMAQMAEKLDSMRHGSRGAG